jgi:hypothetical protein
VRWLRAYRINYQGNSMTPTRDELLKLDTAFNDEIKRVSTVEYNSNEICRSFYGKLRERYATFLSAHQAQAEPVSSDQAWNGAIAAAASVCQLMHCRPEFEPEFHDKQLAIAEKSIRSLARPSQVQDRDTTPSPAFDKLLNSGDPDLDPMMQPVSGAVDERAAFEAAYIALSGLRLEDYSLEYNEATNHYQDDLEQSAWEGWQTRAALSRAQQAPAVSDAKIISASIQVWLGDDKPTLPELPKFAALLSQPAAAPVSEQTKQEQSK